MKLVPFENYNATYYHQRLNGLLGVVFVDGGSLKNGPDTVVCCFPNGIDSNHLLALLRLKPISADVFETEGKKVYRFRWNIT